MLIAKHDEQLQVWNFKEKQEHKVPVEYVDAHSHRYHQIELLESYLDSGTQ